MQPSPESYRPDIDGLRAIAILAVVAYHSGIPFTPGGFIGVDIFFVISGYLITGLLLKEISSTGRIHIGRFVARRVRRLLPAFFVVSISALGASALLMFPQELPRLAKSAIAASLISSNFHFLKFSGGYFDPSTDLMPLLHTWSLGVEEQYYLVWPIMLWSLWHLSTHLGKQQSRLIPLSLFLLFIFSLAANIFFVQELHATVFYLMPFRAWEFALGGLLVWLGPRLQHLPKWGSEILFAFGSSLIIYSILYFSDNLTYPGWHALLPVLGTAIVIASGCNASSTCSQHLLACKPMVSIGMLSYGWYLWHWPMLALVRAHDLGTRVILRDITISIIALFLSWLTYRLIESPIRYARPWAFKTTRGSLMLGFGLTLLIIAAASLVSEYGKKRAGQLGEITASATDPEELERLQKCAATQSAEDCSIGQANTPIRIIAWGDSHVAHWAPLLATEAKRNQTRILIRSAPTCPPLLGAVPYKGNRGLLECGKLNEETFLEINKTAITGKLTGLIVSARWNEYLARQETDPGAMTAWALAGNWQSLGPNGEGSAPVGTAPYDHPGSVATMATAASQTIDRLLHLGVRVLLIAPVPELYFNGPQCLYLRSDEQCTVPRGKVEERRKAAMAVLQLAAKGKENVQIYDPIDEFCDQKTCYTKRHGIIQYTDHNHLSPVKAQALVSALAPHLSWLMN